MRLSLLAVRARRMTLKRQNKEKKSTEAPAPAAPLPAPLTLPASPAPSAPTSTRSPAPTSAPLPSAAATEAKIRTSGRITSFLPTAKPVPLYAHQILLQTHRDRPNEAELAESAPPSYLSAWLNVHLKKGGKYTRRRLWVVLGMAPISP